MFFPWKTCWSTADVRLKTGSLPFFKNKIVWNCQNLTKKWKQIENLYQNWWISVAKKSLLYMIYCRVMFLTGTWWGANWLFSLQIAPSIWNSLCGVLFMLKNWRKKMHTEIKSLWTSNKTPACHFHYLG